MIEFSFALKNKRRGIDVVLSLVSVSVNKALVEHTVQRRFVKRVY